MASFILSNTEEGELVKLKKTTSDYLNSPAAFLYFIYDNRNNLISAIKNNSHFRHIVKKFGDNKRERRLKRKNSSRNSSDTPQPSNFLGRLPSTRKNPWKGKKLLKGIILSRHSYLQ